MTETTWTATTIALSKLKPWERNPKRISKAHAARLLDLWERLGQFQTIAIGPGGEVYDGHQRLSVLKAKHGGGYVVQVLQASRELTEAEREELTIAAHSGTTGSWDWDALAGWDVDNLTAWGLDEELLSDWNAGATALREMLAVIEDESVQHRIGREGRLYAGHAIEPFKLAFRVEAAWRAPGNALALDLFSGAGQLAAWYRRRFARVVTVDKAFEVGDVDFKLTALEFLKRHLAEHGEFSYVDFDDEGSPWREVQAFFSLISPWREAPFVMALTDGNGLNMKMRGNINLSEMYLVDGEKTRKATQADYEAFEDLVTGFVEKCAGRSGFTASQLSSYRGRENNVVFQTWLITRRGGSDAVQQAEAV